MMNLVNSDFAHFSWRKAQFRQSVQNHESAVFNRFEGAQRTKKGKNNDEPQVSEELYFNRLVIRIDVRSRSAMLKSSKCCTSSAF